MKREIKSFEMYERPVYEQDHIKQAILDMLLSHKLDTTGYNRTDKSRIVAQRYRAKKELKKVDAHNTVMWRFVHSSKIVVYKYDDRAMHYEAEFLIGDNDNEEITNIMRSIANPRAKSLK